MDKVRVAITCEMREVYRIDVDMSKDDLEKYNQIINSSMEKREIDKKLAVITAKYGFLYQKENWVDGYDAENLKFELVTD